MGDLVSGSVGASGASVPPLLLKRQRLTAALEDSPYDLVLYLRRAAVHAGLGYPDLAAGDAYRALLLTDEASDESFEYHEQTVAALEEYVGEEEEEDDDDDDELRRILATAKTKTLLQTDGAPLPQEGSTPAQALAAAAALRCFQVLAHSLVPCGCLRSAYSFCERGLTLAPHDPELCQTRDALRKKVSSSPFNAKDLPEGGFVRREIYPWNAHEPDRASPAALAHLNALLAPMAPKCEVRATQLPVLHEGVGAGAGADTGATCLQLGLFATQPIAPGEVVLREYSLLTASNRHKESVCDACGSELPSLVHTSTPSSSTPTATPVACPDCQDTVFCDRFCFDQAQAKYHPAVCDCQQDTDAIAKDPDDARDADDALYVLLLARLLAMAAHQERHPLEIDEVKYIWGDFVSNPSPLCAPTLPFTFAANIATPLHILEKMDRDIFADLLAYDVWVFNTLYAKFRGTASARKSRRDGRPDVAAVHPLWCLANHDCDPNVTWEWGGRMVLWARESRIRGCGDGSGGLAPGDEVLNHYTDISLPVRQRREWASGSLGGWCMCRRCREEEAAEAAGADKGAAVPT